MDLPPDHAPAHHGVAPHRCGECCTTMRGIGVRYNGKPVLENVDLHLHCGELTAVIGENGAGKTTLVKCLLGEIPHSGEVHFLDAAHRRPDSPVIGYVPQHSSFDKDAPVSVLDLFAVSLAARPACLGVSRSVRAEALEGLRRLIRGDVVFEAGRCRICREEVKPDRQKRKRKSTALMQAKRLERQVNLNWRHADSADASQVFADLTAR